MSAAFGNKPMPAVPTRPMPQLRDFGDARAARLSNQMDEVAGQTRQATTNRVKAGLLLLSVQRDLPDPGAFDAMLRSKSFDGNEARDLMLVAALLCRMPADEQQRLLGKHFNSLLNLARFMERVTLGRQNGGQDGQ